MASVESIAAYSTALSQAQLQSAVAVKALKMAQASDQATVDLLTQTLDALTESIEAFAEDLGSNLDTLA